MRSSQAIRILTAERGLGTGSIRSVAPLTLTLLLILVIVSGCVSSRRSTVGKGQVERGLASWYGPKFHGRLTANGETFDMHQISAAHKTLPFGTQVRVKNLDNGRSIVVRINDRGPFIKRRIIDLSYAAAQEIDMVRAGVARVEIRVLAASGTGSSSAGYAVQLGAFRQVERARRLSQEIRREYPDVRVYSDRGWHRVQLRGFEHRKRAEQLRRDLKRQGFSAVVVAVSGS